MGSKALLQDTDNIRVHLRRQPSDTDPRKTIGASRALAAARQLMNSTDSALHRPPVSTPTTTSLQRSPANSSAYLRSLSLLACNKTTPSVCDVFGTAAPDAVKTLRIVMSTAHCAPWNNGRPLANTSMARSSLAETVTFMSRSLACHLTVAPASRHTRASVRSGPTARVRNLLFFWKKEWNDQCTTKSRKQRMNNCRLTLQLSEPIVPHDVMGRRNVSSRATSTPHFQQRVSESACCCT